MSEFDKHWNEWAIASNCTEDEAKIHFEAGQQAQQAKIDELKMSNHHLSVQLVDSNAHYDHVEEERDELQTRIDEASKQLDLAYPESWGYCVDQAIDILKGNKDENY